MQKLNNAINIKVIGIGGYGCNCLERLGGLDEQGIERIAISTHGKTFDRLKIKKKIALGDKKESLRNDIDAGFIDELISRSKLDILNAVKGVDIVFLIGGISKDVAPLILQRMAELLKDRKILTFVITSKPFSFEGRQKQITADENYKNIIEIADAVICIDNDKLIIKGFKATEALTIADKTLADYVSALVEIISKVGEINTDFNDFKSTIINSGEAFFGTATGDRNNLDEILNNVIENKYFETRFEGSKRLLYVITAGSELSLGEANQIGDFIKERAEKDARIIFGLVIDDTMKDKIKITLLSGGTR